MTRILAAFLSLTLSAPLAMADCYSERRGAGSGRYALKEGLAYDERTNLTWARCDVGRVWQGTSCAGESRPLTFDAAPAAAIAAGAGWRLPTIAELAGLVDRTCGNPATDRVAFPGIVADDVGKASYWSGTPSTEVPGMSYVVDFISGDVDMRSADVPLRLRLVRDGR